VQSGLPSRMYSRSLHLFPTQDLSLPRLLLSYRGANKRGFVAKGLDLSRQDSTFSNKVEEIVSLLGKSHRFSAWASGGLESRAELLDWA
jgi:hypothetical protein